MRGRAGMPSKGPPVKNESAIVIGIDNYEYAPSLEYSSHDAVAISNALERFIPRGRIFLFTNDLATRMNLLNVFRRMSSNPYDSQDNLWFFFSGHGVQRNGRDYLLPSDGRPDSVENTCIPIQNIISLFAIEEARHLILMLDGKGRGSVGHRSALRVWR
jgi:uncharacterized caspase-like protein